MTSEIFSFPLVPPEPESHPVQGRGQAIGHHGEILQGVFECPEGTLHRALVTLPCRTLRSTATFVPSSGPGVAVDPAWKVKALRAAHLTLDHLGFPDQGGTLVIHGNAPTCWGLGSSTSDVTAAIRAVGQAFRVQLDPVATASIAVQAEVASDSVMFEDRTVLFAQREGIVLEDFELRLPALDVVGFNSDPSGRGVDTLVMLPAVYGSWEVEMFRPLLGLLRRALCEQDASLLGLVASASARINQSHLPKPYFDRLERLVESVGAVGLQVAHSGSVVGLLFDSAVSAKEERMAAAEAAITDLSFPKPWRFSTHEPELPPCPAG